MKKILLGLLVGTVLTTFASCKCLKKDQAKMEDSIVENGKPAPFHLDKTKWTLVRIDSENKDFVANKDLSKIELGFEDGYVGTSDGCNGMSATYIQDKYLLSFGIFRSTLMSCDEEYMKSNNYRVNFGSIKSFFVENDLLKFYNDNDEVVATYKQIK